MPDKQMPLSNSRNPYHNRRGSLSNWLFGTQKVSSPPPISQPVPIPFPKGLLGSDRGGAGSFDYSDNNESALDFIDANNGGMSAHAAFLDRRKSTSAMHRTPSREEEQILNGELSW